jgi:hypothetical protein
MSAHEPETTPPTASETPVSETASVDSPAAESAADENKRRFREALDAKKARHGEDHLDAGQTPGHAHGRVETKRTFRRKTG